MYEHTGGQEWLTWARSWSAPQSENQFNTGTHDIGFQLMRSFRDGYRLTGNPEYREALLNGAGSLASRFNPVVGSIRSWDWGDWEYPVIIDNMMNLELLFFAKELVAMPVERDRSSARTHDDERSCSSRWQHLSCGRLIRPRAPFCPKRPGRGPKMTRLGRAVRLGRSMALPPPTATPTIRACLRQRSVWPTISSATSRRMEFPTGTSRHPVFHRRTRLVRCRHCGIRTRGAYALCAPRKGRRISAHCYTNFQTLSRRTIWPRVATAPASCCTAWAVSLRGLRSMCL